jgi:hypothetical protein
MVMWWVSLWGGLQVVTVSMLERDIERIWSKECFSFLTSVVFDSDVYPRVEMLGLDVDWLFCVY